MAGTLIYLPLGEREHVLGEPRIGGFNASAVVASLQEGTALISATTPRSIQPSSSRTASPETGLSAFRTL